MPDRANSISVATYILYIPVASDGNRRKGEEKRAAVKVKKVADAEFSLPPLTFSPPTDGRILLCRLPRSAAERL